MGREGTLGVTPDARGTDANGGKRASHRRGEAPGREVLRSDGGAGGGTGRRESSRGESHRLGQEERQGSWGRGFRGGSEAGAGRRRG